MKITKYETNEAAKYSAILDADGEVVGAWMTLANGERCGWYCPYVPTAVAWHDEPKPDYLTITREIQGR